MISCINKHVNYSIENDNVRSNKSSNKSSNKLLLSLRILLTLCAAYGWWGVLYPEFTMTSDTYRVVYETDTVQEEGEVVEYEFDASIYERILKSDRSRIRFRSRLLVNLTALKEQESDLHDSGKKQ